MPELRFHKGYFGVACLLFLVELSIAFFIKSGPVRDWGGDFLVVCLIYTMIMAFFELNPFKTIIGVGVFAVLVEGSQYFHLADRLGLQKGDVLYIVLGNTFDWSDIFSYLLGCVFLAFIEAYRLPKK